MPHEAFSRLQDRVQTFKRWILRKRPYICQRCEELEFEPGIFSSTDNLDEPISNFRMFWEHRAFKSNCIMCHALKSICPSSRNKSDTPLDAYLMPNILTQFNVESMEKEKELVLLKRLVSTRWFAVCVIEDIIFGRSGYHHIYGFLAEFTGEGADIPGPRVNHINHREVPYGKIRGWMDACMMRHTGVCTEAPKFNHHLNLIDCHTRLIVDWKPGFRYAALSYVWGVQNDGSRNLSGKGLPPSLPRTIKDAITVSMHLGIHYLWVDKYCIRDSGEHKAQQIRNMHNIYRGAEVTIIAVAGANPHYGLPGVHPKRPRIPQVKVSFKGHDLLSTGRDLRFLLKQSEWMRRGWTLQEGLLSRRRLLFTDEQVFFECDKFHCCESIDLLPLNRHEEILRFPGVRNREPELSPYYSSERECDHIFSILDDYTKRQLSHDDDVLDAVRGILAYFEDQHPQTIRHLWGLPFFLDANTDSIAKGLTSSLVWENYLPCKRREGFPSWSWTGWKGKVYFNRKYRDYSGAEVQIALDDGSFISSTHFLRDLVRYREISRSISRFLIIKADTVDIQIRLRDHAPYHNQGGILYPSDTGVWEAALLHPDSKNCVMQPPHDDQPKCVYGNFLDDELIQNELRLYKEFGSSLTWKGIILQHTWDTSSVEGTVSVLVVHKVKDWWERIDLARFRKTEKSPLCLDDYISGREEFRLG